LTIKLLLIAFTVSACQLVAFRGWNVVFSQNLHSVVAWVVALLFFETFWAIVNVLGFRECFEIIENHKLNLWSGIAFVFLVISVVLQLSYAFRYISAIGRNLAG